MVSDICTQCFSDNALNAYAWLTVYIKNQVSNTSAIFWNYL